MYICFELCCLIVGEFFSSLPSWAVCAEWEGDVGVDSVSVVVMNCHFGVMIGNVSTRDIIGAVPS